jgi:hypothetical protein
VPSLTVSNLVPSWEDAAMDGGGSFEPAAAATVVEQAVIAEAGPRETRRISPPERFDAAEERPGRDERASTFSYTLLEAEDDPWVDEARAASSHDQDGFPIVDYDLLRRRDIARELLRARLVSIAEQRQHRSAYELVFLMLAAAVAILLAAPPLVQVLLAAHGTQA